MLMIARERRRSVQASVLCSTSSRLSSSRRFAKSAAGGSVIASAFGVFNPAVVVPLVTTPIAPEIDATPNPMPFSVVGVGIPAVHELTIANAGMLPLEVSTIAFGPGTSPTFTMAPTVVDTG